MKKWIPIIFICVLVPILGYFFIRGSTADNRITKVETRLDGQDKVLLQIQGNVNWLTRNRPREKEDKN